MASPAAKVSPSTSDDLPPTGYPANGGWRASSSADAAPARVPKCMDALAARAEDLGDAHDAPNEYPPKAATAKDHSCGGKDRSVAADVDEGAHDDAFLATRAEGGDDDEDDVDEDWGSLS